MMAEDRLIIKQRGDDRYCVFNVRVRSAVSNKVQKKTQHNIYAVSGFCFG